MTFPTFRLSESKASLLALSSVNKVAQREIFKNRVLTIVLLMMASVSIHAQQPAQADMLNNVAKLKRIEAMQPDSIQPKYQLALQSLSFAVTFPHAPQTENMIAEAEQAITKMEKMKNADQSDI